MKKMNKVLCGVLGLGFLLTGCGTVSSFKNTKEELIYNGDVATVVGDYVYYANKYAESLSDKAGYNEAAKQAYLARIDRNIDAATKKDYTPADFEKVGSDVVGHSNNYMVTLGDYIYYTIPNKDKVEDSEGNVSFKFNYTTLYRCKLNGDKVKKIYTTTGEVSKIETMKHNGKYYIVMLAGSDLIRVAIGNKVSAQVIAEDVTSVAMPETYEENAYGRTLDWNGNLYYTIAKTDPDNQDITGTHIYKHEISATEGKKIGTVAKTLKFVDREQDILFYTYSETSVEKTYAYDSNKTIDVGGEQVAPAFTVNSSDQFAVASIEQITQVCAKVVSGTTETARKVGYVYLNSNTLMYTTVAGKSGAFAFKHEGTTVENFKLLFVDEREVYISTAEGIYKADMSSAFNGEGGPVELACTKIVSMLGLQEEGNYAFDGTYIYYYADLQALSEEDTTEEETAEELDSGKFLYRTHVGKTGDDNYQLLSKTTNEKRMTK